MIKKRFIEINVGLITKIKLFIKCNDYCFFFFEFKKKWGKQ